MVVTLTLASRHGQPRARQWDDLDLVTKQLTSGKFLSRLCDGAVRSTEVTFTDNGWHPHQHLVIVSRNDLSRPEAVALAEKIRHRWLRAASIRGIPALAQAQYVARAPQGTLWRQINDATKQQRKSFQASLTASHRVISWQQQPAVTQTPMRCSWNWSTSTTESIGGTMTRTPHAPSRGPCSARSPN